MPEIFIFAARHRPAAVKRKLLGEITDSMVRHFGVLREQVVIQILESDPTNKSRGGVLFADFQKPAKPKKAKAKAKAKKK